MSINRVILLGRVGQDPEIRKMNNGDSVASFSLATSETWKDKQSGEKREATEWHNIVVFNENTVRVIESYVKKGSAVSVEGKIKNRQYEDRDGGKRKITEIVIGRFDGNLTLEGSKPQHGASDEHSYGSQKSSSSTQISTQNQGGGNTRNDLDDDIPF